MKRRSYSIKKFPVCCECGGTDITETSTQASVSTSYELGKDGRYYEYNHEYDCYGEVEVKCVDCNDQLSSNQLERWWAAERVFGHSVYPRMVGGDAWRKALLKKQREYQVLKAI